MVAAVLTCEIITRPLLPRRIIHQLQREQVATKVNLIVSRGLEQLWLFSERAAGACWWEGSWTWPRAHWSPGWEIGPDNEPQHEARAVQEGLRDKAVDASQVPTPSPPWIGLAGLTVSSSGGTFGLMPTRDHQSEANWTSGDQEGIQQLWVVHAAPDIILNKLFCELLQVFLCLHGLI